MNTRASVRLCAVLLSIAPAVLSAQSSPAVAPPDYSSRLMTLDMLVRNANDVSEREQLAASRPAKPAALSAANFDANKDGKLDDKEFASWTAELRKLAMKTPAAMKRFDADKDGKLSDAEWSAAVTELFGEK